MKQDEIDLMFGKKTEMHPNRRKFIISKWAKKGWGIAPNYTPEFYRIKDLIENLDEHMDKLEGHVVTMYSKKYYPPMVGILEYHGDNGWHFYTKKNIVKNWSYYVGESYNLEDSDIAYLDPHPNPRKIWNKLNYLAWKYGKYEDRFHDKIKEFDRDTQRDFKIIDGKYIWSPPFNPEGNIGDCRSYCPCKKHK